MRGWYTEPDLFREQFLRLRKEMSNLLDYSSGRPPWEYSRLFPLVNVKETDEAFYVSFELPGIDADETEVKVGEDTLTIRGVRRADPVAENSSYHRRERACGPFERTIGLPLRVDPKSVSALYKNGTLTIQLAKEESAQARQIEVSG